MIRFSSNRVGAGLLLFGISMGCSASPGFSTRDLNPILQPIFIPGYASDFKPDQWRLEQTLYITNTSQRKSRSGESLVIDVENYRYELALGYRHSDWVMQATLPLISNQRGRLDGPIEDWHDFFGLPEGNRPDFPSDQVEIEYIDNGVVEYSQTSPSDGLGDIGIALGYHPAGETGYFIGLELPTGSESDYSGNEAVDVALWLIHDGEISPETRWYGLFGVVLPGNGGPLEHLIAEQIWIAQLGANYRIDADYTAIAQVDLHSASIESSQLVAFGNSVQIQLGLRLEQLMENHSLDLFFSEDILVGSAPDISFGIRLNRSY